MLLNNCLGNKNVARIGGEEFIGLIPSNNKDIKDKLDDIMNNVRSIKIQNEIISISIGVSKMLSPNYFKEAKLEADRNFMLPKIVGKINIFYKDYRTMFFLKFLFIVNV